MQGKFKPKFFKDIGKVKEDREIMTALYKVFVNVEKAEHMDEISNIKPLEKFDSRWRIKLFLDKKRDYRGLYIMAKLFGFQDSFTEKKFMMKTGK